MTLSNKRRVFVEEYLRCWNASEAARRAGYAERSAHVQGARLLNNDKVKAEIERRLAELKMSTDEVLLRLAEQARAEYSAYINDNGTVDLARMLKDGKAHLIKGTKWDRHGNLVVEFHDAQAALVHIGRHLKLFTENINHNVTGNALIALLPAIDDDESDDDAVETS